MQKITILALHLDYGGIEKYISYLCKMFENKYDIEILKDDESDAIAIGVAYLLEKSEKK